MENSRHDRAIIMVATYVIGFVSAYIAFGVEQLEQYVEVSAPVAQTIAVTQTNKTPVTHNPSSLMIDDRGLVLATGDEETLLVARGGTNLVADSDVIGALEDSYKLIEAELSRDGLFAYFCVQLSEEDDACSSYVYSVKKKIIYPLLVNGERYTPPIAEHFSSWSPSGYLMVNGYSSVTSKTPWLLK